MRKKCVVNFHIFPTAFKQTQKKIKELRSKMIKVASMGVLPKFVQPIWRKRCLCFSFTHSFSTPIPFFLSHSFSLYLFSAPSFCPHLSLHFQNFPFAGIVSSHPENPEKIVIEFGVPKKRRSPDEDAPLVSLRKKAAPRLLNYGNALIKRFYRNVRINHEELWKFADKKTGNSFRYKYKFVVQKGSDEVEGHGSDTVITGTSRESANNIARWFARRSDAFGAYDLKRWNCENFATFCHTTALTEQQLEEEYRKRKTSGEMKTFPDFLRKHSRSVSLQVERFEGSHVHYHDDDVDPEFIDAVESCENECDEVAADGSPSGSVVATSAPDSPPKAAGKQAHSDDEDDERAQKKRSKQSE